MANPFQVFAGQVSSWGRKIGPGRFVWRTAKRQFVKRVLRRDLSLVLANGRSVILPRESAFSSVAWIMDGQVDDGGETVLRGLHRPGTAFCDIGAHFGFYSVWMSDRASRVYAFEPDPRMHPSLRRNLASLGNARIVSAALSREAGSATFLQAESAPHSKLAAENDRAAAGQRIEVPVLSLDGFWAGEGRPAIGSMKIDTEGHESAVLAGAVRCIQECRPLILVETDASALRDYWPLLEGWGYRFGLLDDKVAGRPAGCWFGAIDAVPFRQGMLFLVPPDVTESGFRAEVEKLSATGGRG